MDRQIEKNERAAKRERDIEKSRQSYSTRKQEKDKYRSSKRQGELSKVYEKLSKRK